ncbi:DUF6542 domain-containing protein [Streptomyces sp. NPDC008001]|uniref:DUF6542 domain-containing protein n=1 Tax=Streptomyces sp. NPDC008001 TaxID=3364804 RepID=UPI0036E79FBA
MEQPSTRTPQGKARRVPPVPRPAAPVGRGQAGSPHRPGGEPSGPRLRGMGRLPAPRLTGLGSGLLTTLWMLGAGWLDSVTGASSAFYGTLFLLAGTVCALWVRPSDLATAPVSAPIAFAVGAVPLAAGAGGDGAGSRIMGLVTLLSLNAGWLYAGTLLTALVALTRRIVLVRRRRRARVRRLQRQRPSRPPRSPRRSPARQGRSRR